MSFGKKIKDADLIGICLQVIISDKEDLEVTDRQTGEKQFIKIQDLQDLVKNYYN